jgi:VRR-NUC domain
MTEDELLSGLGEALTLAGWRWQHQRRSDRALVMGNVGMPDILAVPPGGGPLLAIECKSEAGPLKSEQAAWLVGLALAGATVGVVRPHDYDRALALILAGRAGQEHWSWAWHA